MIEWVVAHGRRLAGAVVLDPAQILGSRVGEGRAGADHAGQRPAARRVEHVAHPRLGGALCVVAGGRPRFLHVGRLAHCTSHPRREAAERYERYPGKSSAGGSSVGDEPDLVRPQAAATGFRLGGWRAASWWEATIGPGRASATGLQRYGRHRVTISDRALGARFAGPPKPLGGTDLGPSASVVGLRQSRATSPGWCCPRPAATRPSPCAPTGREGIRCTATSAR
jgi:hypothetical protein